jgi:hypothetical protein
MGLHLNIGELITMTPFLGNGASGICRILTDQNED